MAEKKSILWTGTSNRKRKVQKPIPGLEDLTTAHFALLREYMSVLNEVSKLRSWIVVVKIMELDSVVEAFDTTEKRRKNLRLLVWVVQRLTGQSILTLSYLIRLFVESHVRTKLIELSIAYLYLLQTLPEDYPSIENYRTWLKDTSETCEKLSSTLNSLQSAKGLAATLWPLLVNVAAALLGISTLKELFTNFHWGDLLPWITFVILPFIYFGIFMTSAFWYKRELFTGLTFFESIIFSVFAIPQDSMSIYQLEDRVFCLLDRGKNREFKWDMLNMPLAILGAALVGLSDWIQDPTKPVAWILLGAFLLVTIIFISIVSLRKGD